MSVLVAAFRADHPHHAAARVWLEGALRNAGGSAPLTLMPMVVASFLRLVTSPKNFQQATPIEDAVAFVDALLGVAGVELAPLGAKWPRLRQLCLDKQLQGNDMPDAWSSACVAQLVSFDPDFRKLLPRGQFTRLAPA